MSRLRRLIVICVALGLAGGLTQSGAAPRSLPAATSGHRPGPDILYAKPPRAPQLENTGPWRAQPILVSGAQAYRGGEWLYQDYLYDDHGATGIKDPNDPYSASAHLFSPAAGTFTYPTSSVYANNAADLVELRVKTLPDATAFRVTLNTLKDASRSAFTIALGDSPASVAWPYGAGVRSPAQLFLTWHGSHADLRNATTGAALTPAPTVRVDMLRRQIQVTVPHATWNPQHATVRTTIGTGLWDTATGTYLKPGTGQATATVPGGGTPNGVAIVNVGPRFDEPVPIIDGATIADTAVGAQVLAMFWRERQQSEQLALGNVSSFSADVNFGWLGSGVTDNSTVPTTGALDRIFASHYSFGQGIDPSKMCFQIAPSFDAGAKCVGRFVGQLQPYNLYVPPKPQPRKGYGLTLLLHSLSANYNQYLATHNQSQLGDRGAGSLVLTPAGRGPDGFYAGIAEADTFEAWADVARHYSLDPAWTVVSGYSMGGFGTYRLLARWPDLFARGWAVVGAPGSVGDQLRSLRNTPLLLWNATADELVNLQTSEQAVTDDTAAGIRFTEDLFLTADHLTLAANDWYQPGVDWLGTATVDPNPAHITYVVDPTEDSAQAQTVADHAYWISGLRARGSGDATVDVLSAAFGQGNAAVLPLQYGAGALTGGEIPALAYVSRTQAWGAVPRVTRANELIINAHNLRFLTIDPQRARVTCAALLKVVTDGPLTVNLAGCSRSVSFR